MTALGVAMDYAYGTYYNRTLVNLPSCADTIVELRQYAHRAYRDLMVIEVEAMPTQGTEGAWAGCTLPVSWPVNISASAMDVSLTAQDRGPVGPMIWYGNTTVPELPGGHTQAVAVAFSSWISTLSTQGTAATLTFLPEQSVWTGLIVVHTSLDAPALGKTPTQAAADGFMQYSALSSRQLWQTHLEALQTDVWSSGIELAGNSTLAALVNSSLYHILAASYRGDWPVSSGPGSLAGNGYGGHAFWDVETWQFPVILPFSLASAQATSAYRVARLPAALDRAVADGYTGAKWPWQCSVSGVDNSRNPEDGDFEQHIGADIALAWKQLYYVSLDTVWLATVYPALSATCEFYACRFTRMDSPQGSTQPYPGPGSGPNCGDKTSGSGNWTIRGVVPPDEAAGPVDDNPYTNVAAALALAWCVEAASILGYSPQPMWRTLSANTYVPLTTTLSPTGPVHQEYSGYNGSRVIQQADVALLQYPLGQVYPPDLAKRDLDYWLTVTDMAGMFTGDTVYAAAYLALGDVESAASQWQYVFSHVDTSFMVFREVVGGTGGTHHFITGAGSFLQVLLYGYSGLRVDRPGALSFTHPMPVLPPYNVTAVKLRGLHLAAAAFDFWYNGTTICTTLSTAASSVRGAGDRSTTGSGSGSPLQLVTLGDGQSIPILAGQQACVPLQPVEVTVAAEGR